MGKKRANKSSGPPPSTSEQIDRDLAASALRKRSAGGNPTGAERGALKRIEAAKEHDLRWQYLHTTRKKDYLEMSGRQAKVVNDQARRYGIPLLGRTIDLAAVIHWVHDWLAENARKLSAIEMDEDPAFAGGDSEWLEKYRKEKTLMARLERLEREGSLVRLDRTREGMSIFAGHIRDATEVLRRQYGPDAQRILDDHLNNALRDTLDHFGSLDDKPDDSDDDD